MTDYKVENYNDIGCMIFSTSEYNPTDFLSNIEKDLIERKYIGNVIFDLLLSNGNNYNRYIEANFDGTCFNSNSYELIESPKLELKKKSLNFYRENINFLENSILSKPIRFMIKKGHII